MDLLPSEIIFHIAHFLEPREIVILQSVCKRLSTLGRDNTLWREQCFSKSSFLANLRRRRALTSNEPIQHRSLPEPIRKLGNDKDSAGSSLPLEEEARNIKSMSHERARILANWDPSYPNEKVNWYDDYIARHAPISTSWLQQPRNRESSGREYLEVRGMGLYTPPGEASATRIVAPLDDGSICLWELRGPQRGAIVARSKSGILSIDDTGPSSKRSNMISTGVTECVSIDSTFNRACIAVQGKLVEIDLETMSTIGYETYPFSITALSESKHPLPLTIGTNLALYLHDYRSRRSVTSSYVERIDSFDAHFGSIKCSNSLEGLLRAEPSLLCAHLYQPGPLSILHSGGEQGDGDIYVAGRFPSILNYDRRFFPRLRGTIHSGASLCSLAFLPYPYAYMEKNLARKGELSIEQVWEAKCRPGKTLIACGEYKSKGSLELFGLSSDPTLAAGGLQDSTMKNRQTSSSSKLLSVANHGTRIVVSDGGGNLKWFERDGFTEVRRWNLTHRSTEAPRGIFGTWGDAYTDSASGDIAIKVQTTSSSQDEKPVNKNDLVLWTGEKLGILNFSNKPGFTSDSFENAQEALEEKEERHYSIMMRRALELQANEVRFVRGLGGLR